MIINGRTVGPGKPCYIIAEIGINYNGDAELAKRMVRVASECGCDAAKVQIIDADRSYSRSSASYPLFKAVELNKEQWKEIVAEGRRVGIDVFATFVHPMDLQLAVELELPAVKISSTNTTNFPLLEAVASLNKPVILSTGLNYLSEVDEAVRFLQDCGQQEIAILQCTSLYPAPPEAANLRAIPMLQAAYPDCPIGYSDHTSGNTCAIAAVALGASVLEKHVTLDQNMPGPDHHFSADPEELQRLTRAVRDAEAALGSSARRPQPAELAQRPALQRSVVAARDLRKGERLRAEDLAVKRSDPPGVPPRFLQQVIGRTLQADRSADEPIDWECV